MSKVAVPVALTDAQAATFVAEQVRRALQAHPGVVGKRTSSMASLLRAHQGCAPARFSKHAPHDGKHQPFTGGGAVEPGHD